jgi:hypothetical protein
VAQRNLWGAYVSADPRTRISGPTPKFACCLLLLLSLAFSLLCFAVQETFGVQRTFVAVVVLILELEKPFIMGTNPKTTLYVGESFIFCLAFHSG